jgi:hypothetical protein
MEPSAAGVSVDPAGRVDAFRWSLPSGIVPLPSDEAFPATFAAGISADARRIVGWATHADGDVAVIWDETGRLRPVSDLLSAEGRTATEGWRMLRARAISADGRAIVGEGLNPSGMREAWLVRSPTFVPDLRPARVRHARRLIAVNIHGRCVAHDAP